MTCPSCGSDNVEEKGTFIGGLTYYHCKDCNLTWPAKKEKSK